MSWTLALSYGALSGLVHFLYNIFYTRSYTHGDLSIVYPIMRSSPAFVLLFALIFLQEQVSIEGLLGIVAVVFGVYIINLQQFRFAEFLRPLTMLFSDKGTKYAFLTMLMVACYSVIDKIAAEQIHPFIFSYVFSFCTFMLYTPYVFLTTKDRSDFKREWIAHKKPILINSVIGQGGYILILIAFTFEKVSYVAGFRQLSIVFAVLMGTQLLQEDGKKMRLLAASIICLGAILIAGAR